jgi:mannan endo-1,4-beta-mannosidase
MSDRFSRRKILYLGSSLIAGATVPILFSTVLWGKSPIASGKTTTLHTRGRHLYHGNGSKIVLRGVNLPLFDDWSFPQRHLLSEVAKTGANAVRIQWYQNYNQSARPAVSAKDLDKILTQCRAYGLIPILYLADSTCKRDLNLLNRQLVPWWISPPILTVLKKHQRYLIVNLANELGHYRWTDDRASALTDFKNAYQQAVATIRQHLQVPIAIDAPDCGSSIEVFLKIAKDLIDRDPAHNLLFSGHAYWTSYNGMPHISAAIKANIPLFFGEIANKQDEEVNGKTQYCYYDLEGTSQTGSAQTGFTYQSLLPLLQRQEIGWLAWCWWKDKCHPRQMTSNGTFAKLTPYGRDLVYNSTYGLKATAKKVPL